MKILKTFFSMVILLNFISCGQLQKSEKKKGDKKPQTQAYLLEEAGDKYRLHSELIELGNNHQVMFIYTFDSSQEQNKVIKKIRYYSGSQYHAITFFGTYSREGNRFMLNFDNSANSDQCLPLIDFLPQIEEIEILLGEIENTFKFKQRMETIFYDMRYYPLSNGWGANLFQGPITSDQCEYLNQNNFF